MSKISMTRARRRKINSTISDARRTAHDAVETVKEASGTAKRWGREGTRRSRAAGRALAGRTESNRPWYMLAAGMGAIGAGLGALATIIGRRVVWARRRAYAEDLSASVAKELGVSDVDPTVVTGKPATAVNGSVPASRTGTPHRTA